jgi:nitric oxide reductase NorD protein
MEMGKALGEKLGQTELVAEAVRKVSPLLDDEGMRSYLALIDSFASLDPSFVVFLLGSGHRTLSSLRFQSRGDALKALVGMGRSKWSVVEHAYRTLPLVSEMEPGVMSEWLRCGNALADIDQDVAIQFFEASPAVRETLGEGSLGTWALLGIEIAGMSWKAAREYFRSSPEVAKKTDACDFERWARIGVYLIEKSPRVKAEYDSHSMLAQGRMAGKSKVIDLAVQYFKSAPQILGRLSIHDIENWVEKGLEATDEKKERGAAYFSLQTGASRREMETLVKGVELKDIHGILSSYARAFFGRRVQIRSSSLFYKNLPGLSRFFSVTDGTRIFLPSRIDLFRDEEMNFKTYKWALSHELAHLVFGTFTIGLPDLAGIMEFQNPLPALKIFEFLEDERVDHLMGLEYPGLERDRRMIMGAYIARTHEKEEVRGSLFETLSFRVSGELGQAAGRDCRLLHLLKGALSEVLTGASTVRDVLGVTLRLYESLNGESSCELCDSRETSERVFYRGIIDFKLVDEARKGMASLVADMTERFQDRNIEVKPEEVGVALQRIDEAEGPESETLIWQINDREGLDELFERVKTAVEELEEEKRFRRTVFYDEWDMKIEDYRKDWCRVREMEMPATSLLFYEQTVKEYYGMISLLRRHFGMLRPDRFKRYFREERGDDLDLDAVIESIVERHAGKTPSDRVYIRRDKKLRDVAVAFLVDMSYSTGEVLPSGKRIIDVEREGLVLMAEALESIGDRWAVFGFSTERKEKADFFIVRDFDEPFTDMVKMRFESIRPIALTRLGAAIRHANSFLVKQPSLIRLLILLSDGRPYDVDYGDVDYAVEDTKMALWEGRNKGIKSYCITVDKKSRDYLPHMYGEANYTIIDNIEALPVSLPLIYKKLTM